MEEQPLLLARQHRSMATADGAEEAAAEGAEEGSDEKEQERVATRPPLLHSILQFELDQSQLTPTVLVPDSHSHSPALSNPFDNTYLDHHRALPSVLTLYESGEAEGAARCRKTRWS
jgi:hypothetical protein